MRAGKFIDDFPEPWNHEPLNQAVAGTNGECDALLFALGAKVIERTQLFAREFCQSFALLGELQNLSAALRHFAAEELRKFAELPAVLTLAHGIAGRSLRDAARIAHFDQN